MKLGAAAGGSLMIRVAQVVGEQQAGDMWRSGVIPPCPRASPEAGVPKQDVAV